MFQIMLLPQFTYVSFQVLPVMTGKETYDLRFQRFFYEDIRKTKSQAMDICQEFNASIPMPEVSFLDGSHKPYIMDLLSFR